MIANVELEPKQHIIYGFLGPNSILAVYCVEPVQTDQPLGLDTIASGFLASCGQDAQGPCTYGVKLDGKYRTEHNLRCPLLHPQDARSTLTKEIAVELQLNYSVWNFHTRSLRNTGLIEDPAEALVRNVSMYTYRCTCVLV